MKVMYCTRGQHSPIEAMEIARAREDIAHIKFLGAIMYLLKVIFVACIFWQIRSNNKVHVIDNFLQKQVHLQKSQIYHP